MRKNIRILENFIKIIKPSPQGKNDYNGDYKTCSSASIITNYNDKTVPSAFYNMNLSNFFKLQIQQELNEELLSGQVEKSVLNNCSDCTDQ